MKLEELLLAISIYYLSILEIISWIVENPSLITAIATVVLACATFYYAYTNHKLWSHSKKDTMKPIKLDELCFIIKPFIEICNDNLKDLRGKKPLWIIHNNRFAIDKFSFHESVELVYSKFIKGKHSLKRDIRDHDEKVEELKEKYNQLMEEIKSHKFQEYIEKSYEEFEKTPESQKRQKLSLKELPKILMYHILNETNIEKNTLGDVFRTYWNRYGKKFLKMKTSDKAKTLQKEIDKLSKELEIKLIIIKDNLENILADYTDNYGISLEEIESKDMPKDEKKKYLWET